MKKLLTILFVLLVSAFVQAQNVQLFYDFGKDHQYITSTVEMFKPDKWGSTFFFIDMNYDADNANTVSLAYWEIARAIKLGKSPLALHAEFNGGFGQWYDEGDSLYKGYAINNAWLAGLEYSINSSDFSRGVTFQAMYKYIRDKNNASFQLTTVWYLNLLARKVKFNGFADFWREDNTFFNDDGTTSDSKYVFLSQPQIWYNFTENISLGTEIDFNYNFGGAKGFVVNPMLGAKWTF
jgi:hypothetical protein